MSHQDAVTKDPKNYKVVASTKSSKFTIIENSKDKIFGIQFHPEVTHTDNGNKNFRNFYSSICKIKKNWSIVSQNSLIRKIKSIVKKIK